MTICVYCGSSVNIPEIYVNAAEELGALLADNGIDIVNGAGNTGLMDSISNAALQKGGKVTGIIPQFMVNHGWQHTRLTDLIVTKTMHERKTIMANMSDAFLALPGGCGTYEELFETITWKQLGLHNKPIIVLNTNGYYNYFDEMMRNAMVQGFMNKDQQNLWKIVNTPSDVINYLKNHLSNDF